MIFGIGVDIVRVARIERIFTRYGDRFARRILTAHEYAEYLEARSPARFLSKRFAAKEAIAKAMGLGFRGGLSPRLLGVARNRNGQPQVVFVGDAEVLRVRLGIGDAHISISDERDSAVACAVLLKGSAAGIRAGEGTSGS